MGAAGRVVGGEIPAPLLRASVVVATGLLIPLIGAYLVGGVTAAMAVGLGYVAAFAPATMVPSRFAVGLVIAAAMTGVVAASVNGQPLPAACFVAVACLLVAPANMVSNGLLGGLPTVAAVLAANPLTADPVQVGGWMLVGGLVVVLMLSRLRPDEAVPDRVDPWTAWVHAVAMAVMVGVMVGLLNLVEVPHGYWVAVTLSVILRPQRSETQSAARDRVVGTLAGAIIGLGIALLVPAWLAIVLAATMLILVVANAALGRLAYEVMYTTPLIILLGSGGGAGTVGAAVARVVATLAGALLAGVVALWIARLSRVHQRQARDPSTESSPVEDEHRPGAAT